MDQPTDSRVPLYIVLSLKWELAQIKDRCLTLQQLYKVYHIYQHRTHYQSAGYSLKGTIHEQDGAIRGLEGTPRVAEVQKGGTLKDTPQKTQPNENWASSVPTECWALVVGLGGRKGNGECLENVMAGWNPEQDSSTLQHFVAVLLITLIWVV